jgi:acyl dehydratase
MDSEAIAGLVATLRRRIGTTTTATIAEVEQGAIRKFMRATGDSNPLHWDAAYARRTRHAGIVAPPTFVAAFVHGHIPEILVQDLPFQRMLHAEDAVTSYRLMRPGDVITAYARYADAFCKAGARGPAIYQVADLILNDAADQRVAEVRITAVSF